MRLSAIEVNILGESGLWGDTFCIHWLSLWLNIPICIWSLTHKRSYLHFYKNASHSTISILFHDVNPLDGHYEPRFSKVTAYNIMQTIQEKLPILHCDIKNLSNISFEKISELGLQRFPTFSSSCGESMFVVVALLVDNTFGAISLHC